MYSLGTRCHLPETSTSSLPVASLTAQAPSCAAPGCITSIAVSILYLLSSAFPFAFIFLTVITPGTLSCTPVPPSEWKLSGPPIPSTQNSTCCTSPPTLLETGPWKPPPHGEAPPHKHIRIVSSRKLYPPFLCSHSISMRKKQRNAGEQTLSTR